MARRGVLRHKQLLAETESKDKFEDLLVFGYACKLFRDDEKALSIDQGKLLIPWNGDDSIKIDRYDARGTLFDLKMFETPAGGYDRNEGLTSEEKRLERLCDEERYFALYKDEAEEAVIKEEEIKRLNQDLTDVTSENVSYHQVQFNYNNETQDQDSTLTSKDAPVKSLIGELGDVVYVPPPALDVPPGVVVPPTLKLAKIIEKTALFISTQGTQMEIIVKAKQANNPMFEFLHFDCVLHPFYQHVLTSIRNGTYVVPSEEELENEKSSDNKSEQSSSYQNVVSDGEGDNYLHPSLQPKAEEPVVKSPPKVSEADNSIAQPAPDIRPLIDKTASYMSKNGRHLESFVQAKGDTRFAFLYPVHALHSYYLHKLTIYSEMHKIKPSVATVTQPSLLSPLMQKVVIKVEPVVERYATSDLELMRIERRKKAALFLDQMKKERTAVGESNSSTLDDDSVAADSESTTTSTAAKIKSSSPEEVEIIGAIPRESRERTRSRSRSWTPPLRSRKHRERSRSRHRSRSRSLSRSRSRSRQKVSKRPSRSKSRSRSTQRSTQRSPSSERHRRRHHKRRRSREKHRKEKKKRRTSRDKARKKSRRHRSRTKSRSRSASTTGSRSSHSSRSRSPAIKSRSPSEQRHSPITLAVRKLAEEAASKSGGSETSSPLPSQLLTVQPAFAKIAEGIRAKLGL